MTSSAPAKRTKLICWPLSSLPRRWRPTARHAAGQPPGPDSGQVFDLDGLDLLGQREAEDARIEIQLRFQRALDGGRLAEAVLLALKRQVRHGQVLRAQRFHHALRLR